MGNFTHLDEAVNHSGIVGNHPGSERLSDDARLDSIYRNHDSTCTSSSKASDERVFYTSAGSTVECKEGELELLEKHPREGVRWDLLHN